MLTANGFRRMKGVLNECGIVRNVVNNRVLERTFDIPTELLFHTLHN